MKLRQLKQLLKEIVQQLLKESVDHKFFWLDPNGKFIQVKLFGHYDWAARFLEKKKIPIPYDDVYSVMAKLRYYRVVYFSYGGEPQLEYTFPIGKPPSNRQLKAIKDLAIELNVDRIQRTSY